MRSAKTALAAAVLASLFLSSCSPRSRAEDPLQQGAEPAASLPAIDETWRFKPGDDVSWADPSLDDSDWRPIRPGLAWEKRGFPDYDGYAWYRVRFRIPESAQNDPRFQRHRSLRVTLGKIDDVDQTWFNGEIVGQTGAFPEAFETAWQTTRAYNLPEALIRWDADNVLAVRVYDEKGPGGMYRGTCRLAFPTLADFLEVAFDLGRGDGIFREQDGTPFAAEIRNEALLEAAGAAAWTIEDDEGSEIPSAGLGTFEATIPPEGTTRFPCPSSPTTPGFYRVTFAFRAPEDGVIKSSSMVLGYRPESIRSASTRPSDLDEFWRETLAALAAVKPRFEMTRHAERDSATHEVYEVEMRSLGGVRVRGWYEKPRAEGKHPALLRVPGYTSSMWPTGSSDPLAIFSFNIRAHGNSQDDVSGTPEDYWIRGLDDRHGYFYQGAYADCVRAVDFLASRPEIDVKRIAITGGSQGGGLSLATAALDARIALCAPDIPFLCDWEKYFKASHWPEMEAWVDADPDRTWETTLRTLSYFDTLHLADRIECPVFLSVGLQDSLCPPATIFAVYNRLAGPKEYRVYAHERHSVNATHREARRKWILTQ